VIANESLITRTEREKRRPKKFATRPNLSPVAVRLRLLTRKRRQALPS